eukprot:5342889-Amphidinium_carterae.1
MGGHRGLWPARCKAQLQLAAPPTMRRCALQNGFRVGRERGFILATGYGLSGANGSRDIGTTTNLSRATAMLLEGMVGTTCRAIRLLETTNVPTSHTT